VGHFIQIVGDIEPYIVAYGAAALFVVVYLESFGTPLPGETAIVTASLLAARSDLSLLHVFIAAFVAAVLGDSTGYLIGRFGGRKLMRRFGSLVRLTPERLRGIERQFVAKGPPLVVVARFFPVLRQLNGVVAGTMAMPWPQFLIYNALGALLWTSVWTFGPYFFADAFRALR
jgi:membrane protein DedA with SNARE-associated domain